MKSSDGLQIMVLSMNSIQFRIWVEFLIGQFILEVTFPRGYIFLFDWDLWGEYQQPIAQVGGA